jgi:hypothetical protein
LPNKWKFNGVSSKSQWFLNLVTMVLHMEFKLKTKGFSMDINFFLIGFSMEFQLKKKILEGNHHRENFFFFFSFLNI